jgi:hypothetical protein
MLKWKRNGAGNYTTQCGRFNLMRCEEGYVFWNLYCVDRDMTLDDKVWGAVDGFNTKWQAQEAATWLVENHTVKAVAA